MARMIPNLLAQEIDNDGERLVYNAAEKLPDEYVVLYSFKYRLPSRPESGPVGVTAGQSDPRAMPRPGRMAREGGKGDILGEADFVIAHPDYGFITLEVKQGQIMYNNGVWYEIKSSPDGRRIEHPLTKDPVDQARNAMFTVLELYKDRTGRPFPLRCDYAVCFPECRHISGQLPASLAANNILLSGDLDELDDALRSIFGDGARELTGRSSPGGARLGAGQDPFAILVDQVLAPHFKLYTLLEDRICQFERESLRVLTDEQQRIIEETEYDTRKVFFGAAGTGKTFVAMEKARRLRSSGKHVLFTCFNKNLATRVREDLRAIGPAEPRTARDGVIVCANFHDLLLDTLRKAGFQMEVPEEDNVRDDFFKRRLPQEGFDFFSRADDSWKFDSIIVDEGQDFREEWFVCLEAMLRDPENGEFYVFADPSQDLFGGSIGYLKRGKLGVSRHKLTRNLRNTKEINDWANSFVSEDLRARPVIAGGVPVHRLTWSTPEEERKLVEREIGRLISQGLTPRRITILSPRRREKSCLASVDSIHGIHLYNFPEEKPDGIRFATIRSFKGLESDVVFLIDIVGGAPVCTDADIYVGGSRARYLLYVFVQESPLSTTTSEKQARA